ncbi:MAG: ABC transporter ATP-binding protein [Chloroflexales bacterium]|nr:ABC transporter ATP-binding protein [Chloroflexales bacterium]
MSTETVICTERLTKHYKRRIAVDNLSLEVRRGEVFGFLGPNGAGKTTTILMLLNLVKPTSGRALVLGHNVQQNPVTALRRVGAMIEAPAFYPYLSGRDNLRVLARADGLSDARITPALAAVELESRARDRFGSYSQGMKQRLAIAATLLADPELIILDEPTNGLDPAGTVEIRALIRSLAEGGRTIFLCSHLLHEVEQVCQRVAILKEGRMVAEGRVEQLLRRGQGIQVRVASEPTQALALLRAIPWVSAVEQCGDMLLIDAPNNRAPEINALLAHDGVLVAEMRAREASLEEFFLEVTGAS